MGADYAQRAAHVAALVDLVTANGFDGIDLDYEAMNFGGFRIMTYAYHWRAPVLGQHGAQLSVT